MAQVVDQYQDVQGNNYVVYDDGTVVNTTTGDAFNANGDPIALTTESSNPTIPSGANVGNSAAGLINSLLSFGTGIASAVTGKPVALPSTASPVPRPVAPPQQVRLSAGTVLLIAIGVVLLVKAL